MKKRFTFLIAALMLLVFMTPSMVGWGQTRTEVTDHMTASDLAATGTTYIDFSNVTITSDAVYAGQSAKDGSDNIQLRSKNSNSGIVTTTSGGTISSITITVGSGSNTIDVYGSNTAYTAASSLYNNSTQGTKIGSLSSTGTINVTDSYAYVGIRSNNGAVYISSIDFVWTTGGGSYTITAQSNNPTYGTVSLSGNVITGSPNSGYRYASPAYTVTSGTATVSQSGNDFTVTPSSDCTVTINFEAIPAHTATFSVNGATTSQSFLEGAAIVFPSDPANISGRKFVGWVKTPIAVPTDDDPSFVNTDTETMGNSNVTYYAVFAIATSDEPVETKTQTLQYDTWTYGGTTSNQNNYRLFGNTGYVQSSAFDLSKLSKVIVYGGTYGGSSNNSLTISDGTNTWKSVTVSGSSNTGTNTYTDGTPLTGTKALYVTSNSGNASGSGVRMSKVEIFTMETQYTYSGYCTSVEVYTITAVSNNTDYGTVSLSGEVITGSPQSGYRYATPAYTVSPANSATVVQDGNEFTVTPSANTTVTINFELIPTYTLSSAVSPENAGMVTLGASSGLLEGATVSAEAAANAGYKFSSWSISGTGATLSSTTDNPTTVTIGTANATVTANFEEVTTYAITYSVNGVTDTVNVEENTAVDLSAPNSALIPLGYVFKGWRTSTISTPTDTDPNDYVTSETSKADITYYAVMAVDSESNVTTHLTSDEIATNFAATAMAYADEEKSYNDTDENMKWSARCNTNKSRHWIQLKSDNNVYIKAVAPQNITEVKVTISNATNETGGVDDITKHGAFSGSVNLDKVQNNNAGSCGTAASSAIVNNILTINANGTSDTIYIHVTGAARIWNVDVTYVSINTTNFCTSVSTIDLTEDVTIDGDLNISYELTVPSGKTLTVTGNLINTNPANLVIEDGGQLKINNNATVAATIKKSTAASSSSKTPANNLYAIASPVDGVEISSFAQGYAPSGAHNVYRYDEPSNCWQEYRNTSNVFTTLTNGRGYLYRSSEAGVDFAGDVTGGDKDGKVKYTLSYAYGVAKYKGLNLVGNPFTHNITWSDLTLENVESSGCYMLVEDPADNDHGKWKAVLAASVTVKPMQAFFVQATAGSASITFKNTAGGGKGENYANDNIMFSVKNSKCSDEAYVMFAEGHGLNKIEHRNSEIPMLYIMNNGQNYAIADMSDDTEVINIGFEAKTMGQYTFSIKTEGQYSYMHLVDKLTGEDVDMLVEDSYTFVGAPNDRKDRFVLNLNYNAANINTDSDIFAYQSGSDIIIRGDGELHVFDVMGRLVLTQRVNGVETISMQSQGVYIFKLNGMTQKIVVR